MFASVCLGQSLRKAIKERAKHTPALRNLHFAACSNFAIAKNSL